jgi:hypothetical protein
VIGTIAAFSVLLHPRFGRSRRFGEGERHPAASVLEADLEAVPRSFWLPSLLFRELSPCELAFREKLEADLSLNYLPVMHGLIELCELEQVVVVRGRLNWSAVFFILMFTTGPVLELSLLFLPFSIGVFGLSCVMQGSCYRRVATFLTRAQGAPAFYQGPAIK